MSDQQRERRVARAQVVRSYVLGEIVNTPLGNKLFLTSASGRLGIEAFVRIVIDTDAMFAQWGEPMAFRQRYVEGTTQRYVEGLGRAQQLENWATRATVDEARLRAQFGLDTPQSGV